MRDSGRGPDVAALFADDGIPNVNGRQFVGPDAIVDFGRQSAAAMSAIEGLLPGKHHVSSRMTDQVSDDIARSQSVFLFVGTTVPGHLGTYRDRLVRSGAGWRFAGGRVRITGFAEGSGARSYVDSLVSVAPDIGQ
ncbi:nuclear transport factor 2 family protein [Rhodococcoides yunnanense]|uniref:Nuclear transport factor 2 family protein n=1 Tax=Rhodococcoides yunnanense TaxID=278209 RepID=A0ABU4BKH6_9NOCA|nr:nuclear transport factor 2 family protein [Rhodococcus yunnanensis]MDV6264719.1 nuclear transport factor 2 family protein [Rhodococcus yunnanensis]